jgi:aspartokinase-like uncharacterized kinase
MRSSEITVVKLGGSLAGSSRLVDWLDALAGCGRRVVVVPGGGPFADAVRDAQAAMGFSDDAAHHMALLAMEQYGRALAALRPGFVVAGSLEAIGWARREGAVPIWSPVEMTLQAADIPASWEVTSDSLAAWLAGRVGAAQLLLVKRGAFAGEPRAAADLVARGVVDPAFPRYLAASRAQGFIVGADDPAAVADAAGQGRAVCAPIVLEVAAERVEAS